MKWEVTFFKTHLTSHMSASSLVNYYHSAFHNIQTLWYHFLHHFTVLVKVLSLHYNNKSYIFFF